jgi:hypothetical protein
MARADPARAGLTVRCAIYIGRAIFVFAGRTAENFDDFKTRVSKEKGAKGPDFISRLKAHLNILPINEK